MVCFTILKPDTGPKLCDVVVDIPIVPIEGRTVKEVLTDIAILKWGSNSCIGAVCYVPDICILSEDIFDRFPNYSSGELLKLYRYRGKSQDISIIVNCAFSCHYSDFLESQDFRNILARYDADFLLYKIQPVSKMSSNVIGMYNELHKAVFTADTPCNPDFVNRLIQMIETFRVVPVLPNECLDWCIANAPKALTCCSTRDILTHMFESWCRYYYNTKGDLL